MNEDDRSSFDELVWGRLPAKGSSEDTRLIETIGLIEVAGGVEPVNEVRG